MAAARWVRVLRVAAAVVFAAATITYAVSWIVVTRTVRPVQLGFDAPTFVATEGALRVDRVMAGSPAELAGIRPGDRIVEIDGQRVVGADSLGAAWSRHVPGETVRLTIARPGIATPLRVVGRFRGAPQTGRVTEYVTTEVRTFVPIPFVVVGLAVLFLRLESRDAWLLALLLGSFTTIAGFPDNFARVPEVLRNAVRVYNSVFIGLIGPLFYWFFAVFPARSALDRRMPWLKWAAVAIGLVLAANGLTTGGQPLTLPARLATLLGDPGSAYGPFWFEFTFIALGLLTLAVTFSRTTDVEVRRKTRVVFWGTVAGVAPSLLVLAIQNALNVRPPTLVDAVTTILGLLLPASFAYAVLKHRVLEIPVLLKRSARYLLVQRGFALTFSAATIAATLVIAFSIAAQVRPFVDVTGPAGIVFAALLGTAILSGGLRVHRRVSERIDRAFFRRAYDARIVLEDLAEKIPTSRDREELADLVERHLTEALEPSWLALYLADAAGRLAAVGGKPRPTPAGVVGDDPLLVLAAQAGRPIEVDAQLAQAVIGRSSLAGRLPECVVPILGRDRRMLGLLVLGPRRAEEPYSREDRRLLHSVASQAGIALDNIRFAGELAERIEHDRRVAREMEIASEVQTRLLPQAAPALATAACAARCVQARSVGGDYFDFLDLGDRRVGLVLADVSGKGVHAALLSASLQAHLRSLAAATPLDPMALLARLNRVLFTSTAAQHYATLFFGVYDDCTRRLGYVNCGHNPPVVLRSNGSLERLGVTAPVVGLFEAWEGRACETRLDPGDLLAIFSDGVTEALQGEEEFGDGRLIDALGAGATLDAPQIVDDILARVQQFSGNEQSDDLTLMVVKAHGTS